jgi:hypothetical protein
MTQYRYRTDSRTSLHSMRCNKVDRTVAGFCDGTSEGQLLKGAAEQNRSRSGAPRGAEHLKVSCKERACMSEPTRPHPHARVEQHHVGWSTSASGNTT